MQKKIINFIGSLGVLALLINPFFVSAEEYVVKESCPIDGYLSVEFNTSQTEISDRMFGNVSLVNGGSFFRADIKLAVAVYEIGSNVPNYWAVMPHSHQLTANQTYEVPIDLDISILPAGEYDVKVFAAQGDETAVLGNILNDVYDQMSFKISKITEAKNDTEILLNVDKDKLGANKIYADINTINNNQISLLNSKMLAVITQGDIPLGTAIWTSKLDSIKLLSGKQKVTKISNDLVIPGRYTVIAGLISEGVLQPLVKEVVQVGEVDHNVSWSYISKIGFSNYPLKSGSEIVACISNLGVNKNYRGFAEPLALEFTVSDASGKSETKKIFENNSNKLNYFSYITENDFKDFNLTLDLFHQRFSVESDPEAEFNPENLLMPARSVKQNVVCEIDEICNGNNGDVMVENEFIYQTKPFWFYLGITVVGILLFVLLWKRLIFVNKDKDEDKMHLPKSN